MPDKRTVTLRVRLNDVAVKLMLTPKWQSKPLEDAVLKPFVGAFNKRATEEKQLTIQSWLRAELDGQPFDIDHIGQD